MSAVKINPRCDHEKSPDVSNRRWVRYYVEIAMVVVHRYFHFSYKMSMRESVYSI